MKMSKLHLVNATFRLPWTIFSRGQNSFLSKALHRGSSTKTVIGLVITQHQRSICNLSETRNFGSQFSLISVYGTNLMKQNVMKQLVRNIGDQGVATHRPTPFQQRVLVFTKTYPSIDKVPEKVTRQQMKTAMDKFRVKFSIIMVAVSVVGFFILALVGKKERQQGYFEIIKGQAPRDSAEK